MSDGTERVQTVNVHDLPTVCAATITRGQLHMGMVGFRDQAVAAGIVQQWWIKGHGPYLDVARNELVERFMERDEDILLFVDSDMAPTIDQFVRVVASVEPVERPIVGGLYYNPVLHPDGTTTTAPVAYVLVDGAVDEKGREVHGRGLVQLNREWAESYDPDTDAPLFSVGAVGTGFMAIHRSLLERFAVTFDEPYLWFAEEPYGDPLMPMGEDMTFCLRALGLGYPVLVRRDAKITHHKEVPL